MAAIDISRSLVRLRLRGSFCIIYDSRVICSRRASNTSKIPKFQVLASPASPCARGSLFCVGKCFSKIQTPEAGFEPATFCLGGRRAIHCATQAIMFHRATTVFLYFHLLHSLANQIEVQNFISRICWVGSVGRALVS